MARSNSLRSILERGKGFSKYYQLDRADKSAKANAEPRKQEELTSRYEGSHSLFGVIWQVVTSAGWTPNYILWRIPYALLMLMLKDAPHFISVDDQNTIPPVKKNKTAEIFQTMLKRQQQCDQ